MYQHTTPTRFVRRTTAPVLPPPPPPIRMSRDVRCAILCTIGALAPETGGILLGPVGSDDVTDFYFDATAACSRATYSPDHVTLSRKMRDEWLPAGIDM